MDDTFSPSFPDSGSVSTALKRLLIAEDTAAFSVHVKMIQNLEAQPWLGARAAAFSNASMYRRQLIASYTCVALSSLRHTNFESAYLAGLDAAHHALDDGMESDWAFGNDDDADPGFRNVEADFQLRGAAAAVAAAATAAATRCASARSDFRLVASLTAAAKRIMCPHPHTMTSWQRSATPASAAVLDCDGVSARLFRLVQAIFDSHDHNQRCEASHAISTLTLHIAQISLPLHPKRPTVALLACATGGYKQFIAPMIASARKHFLASCCDLKFVIFTDNTQHEAFRHDDTIALARNHGGWPDASLGRTASYLAHIREYAWADYVFATDIDVKFTRVIGSEILGRTVGTLHADNAFYRGDERTGSSTVGCPAICIHSTLTLRRLRLLLMNLRRV
jgi:hypothetical protein